MVTTADNGIHLLLLYGKEQPRHSAKHLILYSTKKKETHIGFEQLEVIKLWKNFYIWVRYPFWICCQFNIVAFILQSQITLMDAPVFKAIQPEVRPISMATKYTSSVFIKPHEPHSCELISCALWCYRLVWRGTIAVH